MMNKIGQTFPFIAKRQKTTNEEIFTVYEQIFSQLNSFFFFKWRSLFPFGGLITYWYLNMDRGFCSQASTPPDLTKSSLSFLLQVKNSLHWPPLPPFLPSRVPFLSLDLQEPENNFLTKVQKSFQSLCFCFLPRQSPKGRKF